jgi:valyl-tRNA synthetase
MSHELPKTYDPSAIEPRWADYWIAEKLFEVATPGPDDKRPVFTILLPPPNVTGRLHMGHMMDHTEMDILCRWKRMSGFVTLWLPGTDHASIATQMMVERQLASEGKKRQDLGREAFIERAWQWKKLYGGAIVEQMKRIGDSVDWDRLYFTMDENLNRVVTEVFVRLYEDDLIYRGTYIVNWCPRCGTAISDLEVKHEDVQGKLYEIRYPVVGAKDSIVVATTRPETMLGDTAVAVNPRDERYTRLHGKKVLLPLLERAIPIILDEIAQPEFGTGAVKITPAHDPNDFHAGQRHNLPQITVMDEHARINENGGAYAGLDRFEARKRVLADLEAKGLLVSAKDYPMSIGHCDRCKTIVEPRLSTQWFVAVNKQPKSGGKTLAQRATEAVTGGAINIQPENYRHIYLNWMAALYDWCISRQLWWGQRIPAWHCGKCQKVTVARETPKKCAHCGSEQLTQDPDVLDTWFSSALLPFTTLGWPEKTRDLEAFYPTSLLITGQDIIFFWVARMILMAEYCMAGNAQGAEPFREVWIHGLVRDAERQKMSKTKGNVLDPVEITEKYGTDAVRFTLAAMASPGTDIAYDEKRTEGYRAFANKIWNAARFMFMHADRLAEAGVWSLKEFQTRKIADEMRACPALEGFRPAALEDRWIQSRFHHVAQQINDALTSYRFHEAAGAVYEFFWGELCDWYIEIVKLRLTSTERETARTAMMNLATLFEGALRLLAPFMPFITEELWQAMYDGKPAVKSVAVTAFPRAEAGKIDDDAEAEMALLQELIVNIRNVRAELKVEPKVRVPVEVRSQDGIRHTISANQTALEKLANVEAVRFVEEDISKKSGARSTPQFDVRVVYELKEDVAAKRERLQKELAQLEREMASAESQLGNESFVSKAPPAVVEGRRKRLGELKVLVEKARQALSELR